MNAACEWVQEHAPALVRGDVDRGDVDRGDVDRGDVDRGHVDRGHVDQGHVDQGHVDQGHVDQGHVDLEMPPEVVEHLAGCSDCRAVTEGTESLRDRLNAWTVPEPKDDLVERTLARLALANPQAEADEDDDVVPAGVAPDAPAETSGEGIPDPTPAPAFIVHKGGKQRRSSIMILTGTREDELASHSPPTRRRLFVRLLTQAAAAAILFVVCTAFVAVFYPAVTFALEDRRVKRCQKQLERLSKAAVQHHKEHPEAGALHGADLRKALISGGYADELDFVCTGHNGQELLERSYVGMLPPGNEGLPADRPVIWDRFANHSSGFNVAYPDGRVETVSVDKFDTWRQRRRGE